MPAPRARRLADKVPPLWFVSDWWLDGLNDAREQSTALRGGLESRRHQSEAVERLLDPPRYRELVGCMIVARASRERFGRHCRIIRRWMNSALLTYIFLMGLRFSGAPIVIFLPLCVVLYAVGNALVIRFKRISARQVPLYWAAPAAVCHLVAAAIQPLLDHDPERWQAAVVSVFAQPAMIISDAATLTVILWIYAVLATTNLMNAVQTQWVSREAPDLQLLESLRWCLYVASDNDAWSDFDARRAATAYVEMATRCAWQTLQLKDLAGDPRTRAWAIEQEVRLGDSLRALKPGFLAPCESTQANLVARLAEMLDVVLLGNLRDLIVSQDLGPVPARSSRLLVNARTLAAGLMPLVAVVIVHWLWPAAIENALGPAFALSGAMALVTVLRVIDPTATGALETSRSLSQGIGEAMLKARS
jgi:hypothetical protein